MRNILDASAVLALLHEEPGHEQVAKLLPQAAISSVNYAEILSVLANNGITLAVAKPLIHNLITDIIAFDDIQAEIVATLRPATKSLGLSLGDRACLALAISTKSPAVTADKIWQKITHSNLKVICIR